jgi:hypothetical protein
MVTEFYGFQVARIHGHGGADLILPSLDNMNFNGPFFHVATQTTPLLRQMFSQNIKRVDKYGYGGLN